MTKCVVSLRLSVKRSNEVELSHKTDLLPIATLKPSTAWVFWKYRVLHFKTLCQKEKFWESCESTQPRIYAGYSKQVEYQQHSAQTFTSSKPTAASFS